MKGCINFDNISKFLSFSMSNETRTKILIIMVVNIFFKQEILDIDVKLKYDCTTF